MPGGAPSNYGELLGNATFTLAVDTASYDAGLRRAEADARRVSGAIGQQFGRGGGAAMGLLYLGQAVDDMQYGFRSVVNNIPQLAMAFGGGAGLAGAVGVAAVAVNQLASHWDSLSGSLETTEGWRAAAEGVNQLSRAIQDNWDWIKLLSPATIAGTAIYDFFKDDGGAGALKAGRARDAAAGEKLWEKAQGDVVDKQRAADFGKAIAESGGLKAVLDSALREAMKAPGADEATQKGRIAKWIEAGSKGGQFNPDAFGGGFGDIFRAQGQAREAASERKATAELNKAKEEQAKKIREHIQGEMEIKRAGIDRQVDDLQKQREKIQESINNRPQYQTFGSVHDMINSMTTERLNRIPSQQLEQLKAIKMGIDRLNQQKAGLQAARFG